MRWRPNTTLSIACTARGQLAATRLVVVSVLVAACALPFGSPKDLEDSDVEEAADTESRDTELPDTGTPVVPDTDPQLPSRPLEVDPWTDDWQDQVPTYLPGPACADGVRARIGAATYPSLQDALNAVESYNIVELCDGEHVGPFSMPVGLILELRGRTGDPGDVTVTATDPSLPILYFDHPTDPMDGASAWLRLSGLTIVDERPEASLPERVWTLPSHILRMDLRDTVLPSAEIWFASLDAVILQSVTLGPSPRQPTRSSILSLSAPVPRETQPLILVRELTSVGPVQVVCLWGCSVRLGQLDVAKVSLAVGQHSSSIVRAVLTDIHIGNQDEDVACALDLDATSPASENDAPVEFDISRVRLNDCTNDSAAITTTVQPNATSRVRLSHVRAQRLQHVLGGRVFLLAMPGARVELSDFSTAPLMDEISRCGTYSHVASGTVDHLEGICPR